MCVLVIASRVLRYSGDTLGNGYEGDRGHVSFDRRLVSVVGFMLYMCISCTLYMQIHVHVDPIRDRITVVQSVTC